MSPLKGPVTCCHLRQPSADQPIYHSPVLFKWKFSLCQQTVTQLSYNCNKGHKFLVLQMQGVFRILQAGIPVQTDLGPGQVGHEAGQIAGFVGLGDLIIDLDLLRPDHVHSTCK